MTDGEAAAYGCSRTTEATTLAEDASHLRLLVLQPYSALPAVPRQSPDAGAEPMACGMSFSPASVLFSSTRTSASQSAIGGSRSRVVAALNGSILRWTACGRACGCATEPFEERSAPGPQLNGIVSPQQRCRAGCKRNLLLQLRHACVRWQSSACRFGDRKCRPM